MDEQTIRDRLVKQLEDLLSKIKDNEPMPHGPQDLKFLCDIEDEIENCLNAWYY